MRRAKNCCFICHKETRASRYRITGRPIDVCYVCYLELLCLLFRRPQEDNDVIVCCMEQLVAEYFFV